MKLFLIRHGETEDNVAQLYAGTRNSELTTHGWTQATRLGEHFRSMETRFTHIFASTLRRAFKTAELIRSAQPAPAAESDDVAPVAVVRLEVLMEQDFGSNEGKSFRPPKSSKDQSVMPASPDRRSKPPRFVPPESAASMEARMDRFLDLHLVPILSQGADRADPVIAIVSHGIILSVLWRRLMCRLPTGSISVDKDVPKYPQVSIDRIRHWSNTGYLELEITRQSVDVEASLQARDTLDKSSMPSDKTERLGNDIPLATPSDVQAVALSDLAFDLTSCHLVIKTINGKHHLQGLKRTRGGIGSSKHDEGQQRIEMFLKKRKTG